MQKSQYALYNQKELEYNRSIGLELSDEENENFYRPNPNAQGFNWTKEQFEAWLSTKQWSEESKNRHRSLFKGYIEFDGNGAFSYE